MTREQKIDPADWPALLQKLKGELGALEEVDRQWLRDRLDAIASIQMDLDDPLPGGRGRAGVCRM